MHGVQQLTAKTYQIWALRRNEFATCTCFITAPNRKLFALIFPHSVFSSGSLPHQDHSLISSWSAEDSLAESVWQSSRIVTADQSWECGDHHFLQVHTARVRCGCAWLQRANCSIEHLQAKKRKTGHKSLQYSLVQWNWFSDVIGCM